MASEGSLAMFEREALNLGTSYMLLRPINRAGRPYGKAPYYLASFKTEFSTKSLPLGYRWPSSRPQPVDCDAEACHHPLHATITRLTCGHIFHTCCMSDRAGNCHGCIICLPNLISDIQKLALAWNKVLLSILDGDDNNDVDEEPGDDDDDKSSPLEKPKEKDHKYFKSPLFKKNIQEKVDKIKSAVNAQSMVVMRSDLLMLPEDMIANPAI